MSNLNKRQDKIKQKRAKTEFRDFLKEIVSWSSIIFYKNNGIISKFPDTNRIKAIIKYNNFHKNRDSLIEKGINYDFNKSFFYNYKKLLLSIDIFNLVDYGGNENSEFGDMILNSKNIYLCVGVINDCENVLYSISVKDNCSNIFNSFSILDNSEYIYTSISILNSFKIFYSKYINNCNNIYFSTNLIGCSECMFCNDLDNVSYVIYNKVYSRIEYNIKKEKILHNKNEFLNWYKKLSNKGVNINSLNTTGSSVMNSEYVNKGYYSFNIKKAHNIILVGGIDGCINIYDTIFAGSPTANNLYGIVGANGEFIYNSMNCISSSNIFYSYFLENCSYCLGCIGLKNKSYCILNKQYTKKEWEIMSDKIFEKMENNGILGDFFPGSMNPFYFNDTIAGLIGGFTKEEVVKEGYIWRDDKIKVDIPEGNELIGSDKLDNFQGYDDNGKWKIDKEILKKVIKDKSGNHYRIVEMEYDFLVKHSLPLPEIHWVERMKLNFGV